MSLFYIELYTENAITSQFRSYNFSFLYWKL